MAACCRDWTETDHVSPLSEETATALLPPQPRFGTYTVPSGATLRCP